MMPRLCDCTETGIFLQKNIDTASEWYYNMRILTRCQKKGGIIMSKTLVAYFSASGVTEKAAQNLAKAAGADLYPVSYTHLDVYKRQGLRCLSFVSHFLSCQ